MTYPRALFKLFLISITVIFLLIFILLALWTLGQKEGFKAYDHPLMDFKGLTVIARNGGDFDLPGSSRAAFNRLSSLPQKDLMWHLKIQRTRDGKWVLYGPRRLEAQTESSGYLFSKSWDHIQELNLAHKHPGALPKQAPLLFKTFVEEYNPERVLLEVRTKDAFGLKDLMGFLASIGWKDRTMIANPSRGALKAAREKYPRWVFVNAPVIVDQVYVLASIFLEGLARLPGDVVIDNSSGSESLKNRVRTEINKRKKWLVIESDTPEKFFNRERPHDVQGVLTGRPTDFLDRVSDINSSL